MERLLVELSSFREQSRRDFLKQIGGASFGLFAIQFLGGNTFAQQRAERFPIIKGKRMNKSAFVSATECPTKLFYIGKKEYANEQLENPFMKALGEGGFQVGELAKFYHSEGFEIKSPNLNKAIELTRSVLTLQKNTTIFDGVIATNDMLIRPNILIKNGNNLDLIEVKAKVFDSSRKEPFRTKRGKIRAGWRPHLYDVAYQKYVINKAYPNLKASCYLMMMDKSKVAATDGLNQKFKIVKINGQKKAVASPKLTEADRKVKLLSKINVDSYVEELFRETADVRGIKMDFAKMVAVFATAFQRDVRLRPQPASICRNCEFQKKDDASPLRSGFEECWTKSLKWTKEDLQEPNVLRIWSFRQKDKLIKAGRIKQSQVLKSDINPKPDKKKGLSRTQRQWKQIEKVKNNDPTPYIDKANLKRVMRRWVYPLHMIDFETSSPAIPFIKGMKPYEGIAFQYSHHVIYEDGRIEQKGEFLEATPGTFPNFRFIRALKKELENDEGSIFRYSNHENTYLNYIYRQLMASNEKDKVELCNFIETITKSTGSSREKWYGKRNMIDLWELVKRYYYDPYTKGSNSIKQVLPAILNSSKALQEKYSKPIYGTKEMPSFNFKNWVWLKKDAKGKIIDPYKQLPKMFQDLSERDVELLSFDNTLGDGGAALSAYGRLQFEEMTDYERSEIAKALLKYCELDTFAMVMIYEGWKDLLKG